MPFGEAVEHARKHGYVIIKDFFSRHEIDDIFARARDAKTKSTGQDLMSLGVLDSFVFNERIIALARELISSSDLYYYGETNLAVNSTPFAQWHRDARGTPSDMNAFQEPKPDGDFINAWRFAVYYADYQNHSGGLKVGPGSHLVNTAAFQNVLRENVTVEGGRLKVPAVKFPLMNLSTTPRDLIAFNLYTYHSGGFVRFEKIPPMLPHIELQLAKFNLRCAPEAVPRDALMIDYCGPSIESDLYIKWRRNQLMSPKSVFLHKGDTRVVYSYADSKTQSKAKAAGIKLRFDRCIAEWLWNSQHGVENVYALDELLEMNQEFSEISDNFSFVKNFCKDNDIKSSVLGR